MSRYSVAFGVFEADHDTDETGQAFSGRTTAALIKDELQTLHIGASASQRDLGGSSLKLKDEDGVNPAETLFRDHALTSIVLKHWLWKPPGCEGH